MENELKSYPLPTETVPGLDLSLHIADLVEVESFINERGIETKNTRIVRYIEYLRQVTEQGKTNEFRIFKNSVEGPFKNSTDWMLYVLREVHELMWIFKGIKMSLPSGIDDKLKIVVGGRDFAALDTDSMSRNTQFELRIASYFCQAGCEVDLSTDTDIIALTNDQVFYLECKRVGSPNKLAKRLSEARSQLNNRMPRKDGKRTVFGCIAADVTKVAFLHNGLTWGMTEEHCRDIIREKLIGIVRDSEKILNFRDCRNLMNYWFQIHIPSLVMNPYPPATTTRFSSQHIFPDSLSRKGRRAVKNFRDIFESASKDDTRNTPSKKLKLRTSVTFPKGTQFNFDDGLLMEYLEHGIITERDINDEVGSILIHGRKHTFSFFDFRTALGGITRELRNKLLEDPNQVRIHLIMRMYAQRFPYEESESDL